MKASNNRDIRNNRNDGTLDRTATIEGAHLRHNRFSRRIKITSAVVFLAMAIQLVAPVASYALTSGPNQPEAASFEPVDTTDMVNMQTGGFTYNLPLLEVPGPEGGYPLSLSYHAGIQPNEDASWVGLGWTLNPGAITRSVNGYPDDWYGQKNSRHQYWSGGETKSVGVTVPIPGLPGANFGLSFSSDTYRGFGVGVTLGYGYDFGPFSASAGIGVGPYGDPSGNVGLGVAGALDQSGTSGSLGISLNTNFQSINAGVAASVSRNGVSLSGSASTDGNWGLGVSAGMMNASMNSNGGFSAGLGGVSLAIQSSSNAKMSTKSSGVSTPFVSYNKTRYWIDDKSEITNHGSLNHIGDNSFSNKDANDVYQLLEDVDEKNIVNYPDPTVLQGGAFLDYDVYSVTAQGLGGRIRPYKFQTDVSGQNQNDGLDLQYVPGFNPAHTYGAPVFRFLDDFSSTYQQKFDPFEADNNSTGLKYMDPFDKSPVFGNGLLQQGISGNASQNSIGSSKYIEIGPKIKPSNIKGYDPNELYNGIAVENQQIKGFSITNESGVTYHYGLPAYSYGEEVYQERIPTDKGFSMNRQYKVAPYAYTWYLTSITGPDFVDHNNNGIADGDDWGYWVNFEYGKWSDNFIWRTPSEGFNRDEDNEFKNCSMGHKEVYYLNAIRTRSHIALFEKNIKKDGKGASSSIFDQYTSDPRKYSYRTNGLFDQSSAQSLRLEKIYLLNSSDAEVVKTNSAANIYRASDLSENVFDYTDFEAVGRKIIEAKAIRVIDFNYDYSLCGKTVNSFDITTPYTKEGKLSLKKVVNRGLGGANLMPPTSFDYDANKNPDYNKDAYDVWGMYKNDLNTNLLSSNENLARRTSSVSSNMVDAWCLTSIEGPLGSNVKIVYESNNYAKSVLKTDRSIVIKSIQKLSDVVFQLNTFDEDYDLTKSYHVGDKLDALFSNKNYLFFAVPKQNLLKTPSSLQWKDPPIITGVASHTLTISMTLEMSKQYMISSALIVAVGGNIAVVHPDEVVYGGGVRVKNIAVNSLEGEFNKTNYDYTNPQTGFSSGVTSYEPTTLEPYYFSPNIFTTSSSSDQASMKAFKSTLYADASRLYAYARNLPPPGVMYEYVTVTNQVKKNGADNPKDIEGKTQYQFEVIHTGMVYRRNIGQPVYGYTYAKSNIRNTAKNIQLSVFTAAIGNVKRIIQFDNKGFKISETINHYLHDDIDFDNYSTAIDLYKQKLGAYKYQGLLQERTIETKEVFNKSNQAVTGNDYVNGYKKTMSAREEYPCISTGQTLINYVNGTKSESETLEFDFYSGAITKSVQTDAYGNRVVTETTPAYRKYSPMGLKIAGSSNKHMLSQVAQTKVYKADANNNPIGYISSSVTTWSDLVPSIDNNGTSYVQNGISSVIGDVWRPQYTYSWLPVGKTADGLVAPASYIDFNWDAPTNSDATWKKTSEATLYDVFSKALENKDLNGNYGTTHMTNNSLKVMLSGSMSKYYEQAYSGAEDGALNQTANGFVKKGDGVVSTTASHTGTQSLSLSSAGQKAFTYSIGTDKLTAGRDYIASVWVKSQSTTASDAKLYYEVGGVQKGVSILASSSTKKAGDWTLVQLKIKGSDITGNQTFTVGCLGGNVASFVDDFRFGPATGNSTAYVYDPFSGELTYILDGNNMYTHFKYDAMGRLIGTYAEKLGVGEYQTAEYQQHYGKDIYTVPVTPKKVYARLEYMNYQTIEREIIGESTVNSKSADVYIRFYSDAACTMPTVADASIMFICQEKSSNQLNPFYYSFTNKNSQTSIFLGNYTLEYSREPNDHLSQDPGEYYTTTLILNSGQNYTAVQ